MASRRERARRRGRLIGIVVYGLVVAAFTSVCSVQILKQVWTPSDADKPRSCRDGVRELIVSLEQARVAAATASGGERDALLRFRAALGPAWSRRPALDALCREDPAAHAGLRELDRLRYAEEHAVRYAETNLGPRRRAVESLERRLFPDSAGR